MRLPNPQHFASVRKILVDFTLHDIANREIRNVFRYLLNQRFKGIFLEIDKARSIDKSRQIG